MFCFNIRYNTEKKKTVKIVKINKNKNKITHTDLCDPFMNNNPCYQLDIAL